MIQSLKKYSGFLVLAAATVYSVVQVALNQIQYERPGVTTIRLCHWQLESGFRDALQELIDEYQVVYKQRTGRDILIQQMPISERGYNQFVNTSLIGGTAPDIMEKGWATTTQQSSYVARFFRPLGNDLGQPNPYNQGTPLEGVPWRETYFDGLAGSFDRSLQDYYSLPFSMFTVRIYYNRDLYRQITGKDEPPSTWDEFQATTRQVWDYAGEHQLPLVPIAGSKTTANMLRYQYRVMFLSGMARQVDRDFNGSVSPAEAYGGYLKGLWSFKDGRFHAFLSCLSELSQNFQTGWTAAQRDDAVFMFIQGRSLMYVSGSWDAQSVLDQVGDKFEVQVFNFPVPYDHPEYGPYVQGKVSEAAIGGGIPWAINKTSRHQEICVDFLRFCTTRQHNERFNGRINWLPAIRGARLTGPLQAFRPEIEGYVGDMVYNVSTQVEVIGEGKLNSLYTGSITLEEYLDTMTDLFERTGAEGVKRELEKSARNNRNMDRILAAMLTNHLFGPEADRDRMNLNVLRVTSSAQAMNHSQAVSEQMLRVEKEGTP